MQNIHQILSFSQEAKDSLMFYRDLEKLEGIANIEFESLQRFVKFYGVEEKVSLSDFSEFFKN